MEEAKKLIEELKGLMTRFDEKSEARRTEIGHWFREHKTPENEKLMQDFLENGFSEIGQELESIRQQIKAEDYQLLPISYIAEYYFGKSKAWLYQRISGIPVRGKVYTLNTAQRGIFNMAMRDISKRIGSICV